MEDYLPPSNPSTPTTTRDSRVPGDPGTFWPCRHTDAGGTRCGLLTGHPSHRCVAHRSPLAPHVLRHVSAARALSWIEEMEIAISWRRSNTPRGVTWQVASHAADSLLKAAKAATPPEEVWEGNLTWVEANALGFFGFVEHLRVSISRLNREWLLSWGSGSGRVEAQSPCLPVAFERAREVARQKQGCAQCGAVRGSKDPLAGWSYVNGVWLHECPTLPSPATPRRGVSAHAVQLALRTLRQRRSVIAPLVVSRRGSEQLAGELITIDEVLRLLTGGEVIS